MAEYFCRGDHPEAESRCPRTDLGDSKLTLGEANHETVLPPETKDLLEVVQVVGEILAKDENVINVDKTER